MPLTKKQIDDLKQYLLKEREGIVRSVRRSNGEGLSLAGDLIDQSADLTERELELELAEHDRERLLEIEEALQRIEEDSYGVCLESGEEIPFERLKAVPTAKYTVRCQEILERRRYLQ